MRLNIIARGQTAEAYTSTRGVCVAKGIERKENNVVEEFKLGNTRVKICDDYCYNCLDDDIEDILARIAYRALEHFTAASHQQ